jgi:hypothetical protein
VYDDGNAVAPQKEGSVLSGAPYRVQLLRVDEHPLNPIDLEPEIATARKLALFPL